jgi:hypothetical protein
MRQRAASIGGAFSLRSVPGRGTSLRSSFVPSGRVRGRPRPWPDKTCLGDSPRDTSGRDQFAAERRIAAGLAVASCPPRPCPGDCPPDTAETDRLVSATLLRGERRERPRGAAS